MSLHPSPTRAALILLALAPALLTPALLARAARAAGAEKPDPATPTTLDITRPLPGLAAVTPQSDPDAVSAAIQSRLDWLHERNLPGRVFLPAGRWAISRPLFMNGDAKEIVGAGARLTTLAAAEGWRAMPMINAGARTEAEGRPLQAANRVRLTGPAGRVLDDSVPGDRFGLRTYAEYPSDHFPAVSHHGVFVKDAKAWAKGTAYQANDVVKLAVNAVPGQLQAVCTAAHTASDQNQPLKGEDWKTHWVVKVPAHVQFFADPLTAGAYDPAAKRAGNWADMEHFTLDFAFAQNVEPKVYGDGRMLCGAVMGNGQGAAHRVWMLVMHDNGDLTFDLTLADGAAKSVRLAKGCGAAGAYRLALQVDFPARRVQAWLRGPADPGFSRTCDDEKTLPPGGRFREMEYGYFVIAGGGETTAAASNYETPPTDITVIGLHTSAAPRYADDEAPRRRAAPGPVDDNFRYFTSDEGTLAFLPLTDHPPDSDPGAAGLLVTVQHGSAAGDARQKGYGYLKPPQQIYGIGRPRVSDLTLEPGPVWGAGVVTWHTLNLLLSDLDCRGGFYAVGDLFYGAQYPIDVRRCTLSGSEAAFSGSSNIVYMSDVTIDPVGRFGILLSGSNLQADRVTFRDSQTHQSQYYFRHVNTVDYGGMNLLTNLHADAPAGCRYPSRAAFSQEKIYYSRTSFVMRDSSVSNMGPGAVFLDLPIVDPPGARLLLERCAYAGSAIAAWVRTQSPYWAGAVTGFDPKSPVGRYLDYRPPSFPEWKAGTNYAKGARVTRGDESWECTRPHAADAGNPPGGGGAGGGADWARLMPHLVFEPAAAKDAGGSGPP